MSSTRKCYPLTVVHIFFYSAIGCLWPFLNLQCRDLGLNAWECWLSNLAAALLSGLLALAFYSLARACGRYKLLIAFCLVLSGLAYTALILIPRVTRMPRHPLMEFDCSAAIRLEKCSNWAGCGDATLSSPNFTSFRLSACQYACPEGREPPPGPLHVCFRSQEGSFCELYDAAAREQNASLDFRSRFPDWHFQDLRQVPAADFLDHESSPESPPFVDVCSYKPAWPLVVNQKNYDDIYCRNQEGEDCQIKCRLLIDGEPSPSHCLDVQGDPALTFWVYLGVRALGDAFLLSSAVLVDTLFVLSASDLGGFYGRSRLWPAFGLAFWPPLVGLLVDLYSSFAGRPDYSPSVFIYDGLVLVTCAVVLALRLDVGMRGQYVVNSPSKRRPFWSLELGVVLVLALILGGVWGLLDASLRPLAVRIGCSKLLVGAGAGLPFLCAMPFLGVAKSLVRNIGPAHLLVFGLLFYAIRLAGLSFVVKPLWTLPFQAMETFTLAVAWLALVAHAQALVSRSNRPAVQFVLYFLHFSAGRALGIGVGAFLEHVSDLLWAYRGLSVFCLTLGLLYLLIHHTCLKNRRRARTRPSRNNSRASNGGALLPLAERRPNGDALHGKDRDEANQQAAIPMMDADADQEDEN